MGNNKYTYYNFKNDIEFSNTFHKETAFDSTKFKFLSNSGYSADGFGNTRNVKITGSRSNKNKPQLHFSNVFKIKTRSDLSSNSQLKEIKRLHFCKKVLPHISFRNSQLSPARGLDDKDRHVSSVFSRKCGSEPSSVFKINFQRNRVPDDMSTVWNSVCAPMFCNDNKLLSAKASRNRYSYCGLSRRFFNCQSKQMLASAANIKDNSIPSRIGLDFELREVCRKSYSKYRISRDTLGYGQKQEVSSSAEGTQTSYTASAAAIEENVFSKASLNHTRSIKLRKLCYSSGAFALPKLSTTPSYAAQSPSQEEICATKGGNERSLLVETCGKRIFLNTLATNYSSPRDRCIQPRLGSDAKRYFTIGQVGTESTGLAQQSQGIGCHTESDRSSSGGLERRQSINTIGQFDCISIPKKRRWSEIGSFNEANSRGMSTISKFTNKGDIPASTGPFQRYRRLFISRQTDPRVAPSPKCDITNISNIRYTSSGLVCVNSSACRPSVCLSRSAGRRSSVPQRLQQAVALSTSVDLPSTITHTTGFGSLEQLHRSVYNNCTPMEEVILETGPAEQSSQRACTSAEPDRNSGRCIDGTHLTQGERFNTGSLVDWSWDSLLQNWTPDEKAVLVNGWRKSTLISYKSAWNRWANWCIHNNISIIKPQSKDLAKFLAYLHVNKRFKPSTIQLYRSAVSTICEPHLGKKLSEDIFVRHVLKSIAQANPQSSRVPIWDPQQIVSWLQNNVPQEVTYFEASRRCAVILLLASGRRVHDLTLLRTSPQHLEDNGTDMILWPVFGSKTDTAKHRQSGWKLNSHEDQRICPVFWIRKVIDLSKTRRRSFQQLFITIHGEPKPASRTVIANWVRTVFKAAGIDATPGSARSAVASYNWINNVPIDMILQKGNWKQASTFHKHYCKEIINNTNSSGNQNLSKLFNSI